MFKTRTIKFRQWLSLLIIIPFSLIATLGSISPGGGGGGSSGGTWSINVSLGSGRYGPGSSTLSLDGKIIARDSNPTGSAMSGFSATVNGVKSGSHTLTITIVSQTATTQNYIANGVVFDMDSGRGLILDIKEADLRVGESIRYRFNTNQFT